MYFNLKKRIFKSISSEDFQKICWQYGYVEIISFGKDKNGVGMGGNS
jgi:hypothetical protein